MPAANLQTSQGQPPDTLGANGDMCWDYQNRFFWGPKGLATSGSWVGTANNANPQYGPTYGTAPGFTQSSVSLGAQSTTPTATTQPNGGATATIAPLQNTPLMAILVTSNVAGSYDVYNQTAGSVLVPAQAFTANATNYYGTQPYGVGQYTLLAGNVYVIRVTGSATGALTGFTPIVGTQATGISQAIASPGAVGFASNTTFNTTSQIATYFGSGVGSYLRPYRNGYIYNVTATYTPSGSSTASNYVNIIMSAYSNSTNATTTFFNYGKAYGTGQPTVLGPFNSQGLPISPVSQYWYTITADSSCTGTLSINTQLVI